MNDLNDIISFIIEIEESIRECIEDLYIFRSSLNNKSWIGENEGFTANNKGKLLVSLQSICSIIYQLKAQINLLGPHFEMNNWEVLEEMVEGLIRKELPGVRKLIAMNQKELSHDVDKLCYIICQMGP